MSELQTMTDHEVSGTRYVGFWARFVACIVDTVLVIVVLSLIAGTLVSGTSVDLLGLDLQALQADPAQAQARLAELLPSLGMKLLVLGVVFVLFWIARSATPGKMIVSAIIVDAETLAKPSTFQLIRRYIGYFISTLGLGLGFAWIAWDPRKQGWHDKLAGTVVIRQ